MFEFRPMRNAAIASGLVAAVAVAFVTVGTGVLVVPVVGPIDPAVGLALPIGLVAGPAGAAGVALGVLAGDVIQSALSWWTPIDAFAVGAFAFLGHQLWGRLPAVSTGEPPRCRSVRQWVELAAVTGIASVIVALALAWWQLLLWGGPFHAIVLSELAAAALSTAVLAPVVLLATTTVVGTIPSYETRRSLTAGGRAFLAVVVAPLVWLVGGTPLSLVLGGRRIHLLVGAVVLALLTAAVLPRREDTDPRSPPTASIDP